MKKMTFLTLLFCTIYNLSSQELKYNRTVVDDDLTSPWNWDIEVYDDRVFVCNERGFVYEKDNDEWIKRLIDPADTSLELRGMDIDENGDIWLTSTGDGYFIYDQPGSVAQTRDPEKLELRDIEVIDGVAWMSTDNGEGMFSFDFLNTGLYTEFTKSNSDLASDFSIDFASDDLGNLYVKSNNTMHIISSSGDWKSVDVSNLFSFSSRIADIYVVSPQEVWIATSDGVALYDGNDLVSFQDEYGELSYSGIIKASNGDLWLCELFEGIAVVRDNEIYRFYSDDYPGIPSQVFEFAEYQDSILMIGNIGNSVTAAKLELISNTEETVFSELNLWPNPCDTELNIDLEFDSEQTITITDVAGRTMHSSSNTSNVDVSTWPDGLYTLLIRSKDSLMTSKFSVKH